MGHVCENWEYSTVPGYQAELLSRIETLVRPIFSPGFDTPRKTCDTRSCHRSLFTGLTPNLYPHFAGNYRGTPNKECLEHYEVGVDGDSRVGSPALRVLTDMDALGEKIRAGLAELDAAPKPLIKVKDGLLAAVVLACAVFEEFLRVHPYANGNGHMARYVVWAILARYGIYVRKKFTIDPRPNGPYVEAITAFRSGDYEALVHFVLDCIEPTPD